MAAASSSCSSGASGAPTLGKSDSPNDRRGRREFAPASFELRTLLFF
jgi:hypothetical protein